jgi:hypothetical protein
MKKKLVGTGLTLGLVAGAGAGLVLELTGSAGASSRPAAVAAAVDNSTPGSPADTGSRPDPSTRLQDVLKPLVADGTITQAQADKVVAALVAARPAGDHPGGPMGQGPMGGRRSMGFPGLDAVATTLGITADDVRSALHNGQSIADLAVSKGKTAQDIIDAVVTAVSTKMTARVTAGDLTQAQADEALADITARVTEFVNSNHPIGDRGFGGPGIGRHGNDSGNDATGNDADGPTDTTAPASGTPATTTPATTVGG